MSRSQTPRRSTRSQSRDPEGAVSSEGEQTHAFVEATSSTVTLLSAPSERSATRKRPKTPQSKKKDERGSTFEAIKEESTNGLSLPASNGTGAKGRPEEHVDPIHADFPAITKPKKAQIAIRKAARLLVRAIPVLPHVLLVAAVLLALAIPTPEKPFRRNVYVDENALQPGSASVEWDWGEVEYADKVAERVRAVGRHSAQARAALLSRELQSIGLRPYNQSYRFDVPTHTHSGTVEGINTYARWSSARGDGREAFVIAASWKSAWDGKDDPDVEEEQSSASGEAQRGEGAISAYDRSQQRRINVRGIATALTIARHLTSYKHWSKDLIFVFGDGELDGMQAWTSVYFGEEQSNLHADDLHGRGSLIWNALAIDYPSDSFSHIVLKHEGLDGQLPNMDVISALTHLTHRAGGMAVELTASDENGWPYRPLGRFGDLLEEHLFRSGNGARKYLSGLWNAAHQLGTLSAGTPSGIHGLFHRYHVDAITIFAHPATGPYGFWNIGRLVESLARSMSNLLERLHHSHFFYILTSPNHFVEVAKYLPIAIFFSAALLISGIAIWIEEGRLARERQNLLIDLVSKAIEDEDDEVAGQDKGGHSDANGTASAFRTTDPIDVALRYPTVAQRTERLVSMLVQRAAHRGDLIGSKKIRSMASLLDIHGRPLGAAIFNVALCHAVGAIAFVRATTAPIACAQDGIEYCKPLRLTSALIAVAVLVTPYVVKRLGSSHYLDQLFNADAILPEEAMISIYRLRSFRPKSVARTAVAFAMMEAGILILTISIVNFSLAAVLGALLSFPLCLAYYPISTVQESQKSALVAADRSLRHTSPASDDSDAVESVLLAVKRESTKTTRARMVVQTFAFVLLTPSFALLAVRGIQYLLSTQGTVALPVRLLDETTLRRLINGALWNYHILSSALLPILCMAYLPLLLVGATTSWMVAVS